jgi:hypothetical protein
MNNDEILDSARRDRIALALLPYMHAPKTGAGARLLQLPEEDHGQGDDPSDSQG